MGRRTIPSTAALIAFEAAARSGSFTKAAAELKLTQGAVSRQVRVLEDQCGQKLFRRERQRVGLSAAGQDYLEVVSPLLEALEVATLKLHSWRDLTGSLTVATYPTLGARWLLPHLFEFKDTVPDADLITRTFLDNSAVARLEADLVIVQGDPPWPGMNADFLMAETIGPVCSPSLAGQKLPLDVLLAEAALLRTATRPLSWELWQREAGYSPQDFKPAMEVILPQFEMVIEAAREGRGVAVIPHQLIKTELENSLLVPVGDHVMTSGAGYYLLSPLGSGNRPLADALRDFLLSKAA